jgi:tripartite-type tricarboxylate transporter receptor subunit TctC
MVMRMRGRAAPGSIVLLAALSLASGKAAAQAYPQRTVEVVFPYPPGPAVHSMGLALSEGLSARLGQRFVLMNKPGANGALGTAAAARAAPDGYTLLFTAAVTMVVNPLIQAQSGYTLKSFDHLCQIFKNEMALVVRPDSSFKSAPDLIAAGHAKPGLLNYGILGIGSIPHLAMVELSQVAKVSFNAVPFKGDADVVQQVRGGHVDFGATVLGTAASSGLRILGLFSHQRNPSVSETPTLREQGYDVAPFSIGGLSAPVGLPADVKQRLATACREAARTESFAALMRNFHQPADYFAGGEEYAQALERDLVEKRRLLQQLDMIK